ncbi:MAG TPA: DoxX family protein [Acidimicrobiia bacterium]|nr:DoxX family protein [Acidimicrobiia bacterium]
MFGSRTHGGGAWATAVVRVVTSVLFVTFSLGKFADHAKESADFAHYGIPAPELATYLVGTLELVGGILLVIGLLTRPAAAVLALNLVGAISTAGRVDGGSFHLGVGPAMLVAMLFLVWAGSGRFAVDRSVRLRLGRSEQTRAIGEEAAT